MPAMCRALVPEVLPAVMPVLPVMPEVLPAPLPELVLPARLPLDLPAEGRAALAAALDGTLPAGQRPGRGELVREAAPSRWDDAETARLRGFLRAVEDRRGRRGRVYPAGNARCRLGFESLSGDGGLPGGGTLRDTPRFEADDPGHEGQRVCGQVSRPITPKSLGGNASHEGVFVGAGALWRGFYGSFCPDAGMGVAAVWQGGYRLGIETIF